MNIKKWIIATRPWSFSVFVIPCLLSISYIFYIDNIDLHCEINWIFGIIALIGVTLFQAAGNLFNDYYDYLKKVDREDSNLVSRSLVDKIFTPKQVFIFASILLIIAITLGIVLYLLTSWELLIIGLLGVLSTAFYNKFKYIALGDLCIFICFGILIGLGTAFVLCGIIYWKILLINIPLALLIVGIRHANNTRDIINDKQAKIKTMAILLRMRLSKIYFYLLIGISYFLVALYSVIGLLPYFSLISFISLPIAYSAIKKMQNTNLDNLKDILHLSETMAKLVLIFGILLCVGNVLGKIV